LAAEAGDKYIDTLAEIQENFVKSQTDFAERIKAATTATTAPAFDYQVPTATEVTEASFAFAEKLLKQQKAFAHKLISSPAAAPASKSAKN
jgi:hypothetical protein